MFSGIVETTARVLSLIRPGEGAVLTVGDLDPSVTPVRGESIATNGVCLTVRDPSPEGFVADLSPETVARTTLGQLEPGDLLNIERSLRVGDRISGHFVFGHVDTVGDLQEIITLGDSSRFVFAVPQEFAPFLVDKGSVAVDGISLTMCDCTAATFAVAVIPHTLASTNLRALRPGNRVNLEADMLARYVRRALALP